VLRERARGPARTHDQLAAAVGATPREPPFGARAAERALEGTDSRIDRVRREIAIAALASGSQLEHFDLLLVSPRASRSLRMNRAK
jgi:hypothetical protein